MNQEVDTDSEINASYWEMVRAANEADATAKANAKAKREGYNASCVNAEPASDEEYTAWKAELSD